MPGSNKIKIIPPPKLESNGLTLDKLQTWYSGMRNCFKHDPDHKQFLKGQTYETWTALKPDKTRGLVVEAVEDVDPVARAANIQTARQEEIKLRESLDDFLHILGSKAPEGMYNTIVKQATSMEWVLLRIKTAFRIQSKGIDLYTATEAGYDEDKDPSYDVSFMKMKDMFEDLLSPAGTQFHGDALDTEESLTPLSESMITIQWLRSIHPDLPKHIKERHAHLFTQSKPNWADLQPDFVKQMDTLLAEVEGKEGDDIRVGRLGLQARGDGRQRGGRGYRGGSRPGAQSRGGAQQGGAGRPVLGRFCDICHAAGKPESVVTSHNMPWCKALSNHGKRSIVSSVRMAFVDEEDDSTVNDTEHEEVDETSNPYQDI